MDEADVCLCVMFNHKYEGNVPKLRDMYKSRFSKLVFLMPFYRGSETDILPYYANSFYFQLCVTQNITALKAVNAKHYVFIGDDLILNPAIDERNAIEYLGASVDAISIPPVANFHNAASTWIRTLDIARLAENASGVEWGALLPTYEDMAEKVKNIVGSHRVDITHFCDDLTRLGHKLPEQRPLIVDPPYPCLAAYSDIFIIPNALLNDFAHYAGITAAMSLFAEVAIPTVAAMVSEKLRFIPFINYSPNATDVELSGKGIAYWGKDIDDFSAECESKISNAFSGRRSSALFLHPIKLSKWT